MVRIRTHYNLKKLPHPRDECSSSSCRTSSDGEDESEGSLADFIEHDSEEGNGEESYNDDEDEEGEETDDEDEQVTRPGKRARTLADEDDVAETTTEEDPDEAIARQYTRDMETTCGSVITETGVRRSMRSNKGRAPVRYVDEDYADLMLEDIASEDRDALAQELTDDDEEEEEASGADEALDSEASDT